MWENIVPLTLFVIVMTGTPGPGNLAMMAIGQKSGYGGALPFLAGAACGLCALALLVGFGLGGLVASSPSLGMVIRVGGMGYILYLAWKILSSGTGVAGADRRFTFPEGLLLHPLNPKTWAMLVVGFSQFSDPLAPLEPQVALFAGDFVLFMFTFHSLWCLAGAGIMKVLTRKKKVMSLVNLAMVLLMLGATFYAMAA